MNSLLSNLLATSIGSNAPRASDLPPTADNLAQIASGLVPLGAQSLSGPQVNGGPRDSVPAGNNTPTHLSIDGPRHGFFGLGQMIKAIKAHKAQQAAAAGTQTAQVETAPIRKNVLEAAKNHMRPFGMRAGPMLARAHLNGELTPPGLLGTAD